MKKTKWLWSYRIEETEEWLEQMAGRGWVLEGFSPLAADLFIQTGGSAPNEIPYRL